MPQVTTIYMSPAYSQTEKSGHEDQHTVEPLFNEHITKSLV